MKAKKIKDKEALIKSLCKTFNQLRMQEGTELKRFETLKSIEALLKRDFLQNPSLCYNLGLAYYEGWPGVEDPDLAFYYFQKAAKEDYPLADFYLGIIYMEQERYSKSASHYKKALDVAALASYNLGVYYEDGMGVRRNLKEAVRYYELAAKNECPYAFHNLATFYRRGVGGLKQDYKKALSLYKKAIRMQDDPLSYLSLAQMFFNGFGVKKNKRRALSLLQTAADKGDNYGKYLLGLYYYNRWLYGDGDYIDKVLSLIKDAKKNNCVHAMLWWYFRSIVICACKKLPENGCIRNFENYVNSVGINCPEKYLYLGIIYQKGYYVEKDIEKARKLLLAGIRCEHTYGAIEDPSLLLYLSKQFSGDGIFNKNRQREEEYRSRWLDYYRGSDYIGKSRFHEPVTKEGSVF